MANSDTKLPGVGVSIHGLAKTFRTLPPANLILVRIEGKKRCTRQFQLWLCFVFRFDLIVISRLLAMMAFFAQRRPLECGGPQRSWSTLNRNETLYLNVVFRALMPKMKRSSDSAPFATRLNRVALDDAQAWRWAMATSRLAES